MSLCRIFFAFCFLFAASLPAAAQVPKHAAGQGSNFPDRKAVILNNCPHVELSDFSFENRFADRRMLFEQSLSWKNVESQALVAFDVIFLKYDAFDQRVIGTRMTVTGNYSANWRPLAPGESNSDRTIVHRTENVFTVIDYIMAARLADGTVWLAEDVEVLNKIRSLFQNIKEMGSVKPDPK